MNDSLKMSMALACFVGSAVSATAGDGVEPLLAEFQSGNVRHVGHIYYNIATGEKITTLIEGGEVGHERDAGDSNAIWIMGGAENCGDDPVDYFTWIDSACTGSPTSGCGMYFRTDKTFLDWGDIPMDTVVDCVQVHWLSNHVDTDLDDDGIGDGVYGFGGQWTFWDGMNGRTPQFYSIAQPIVTLEIYNLPGEISDPNDSTISFYSMDVDLAGDFGYSLAFEIGDTDSDLNGAAIHIPRMDLFDEDHDGIPDIDPDQDGLADWGWSVYFVQPGTQDIDNADGDFDPFTGVDGNIHAKRGIGINLGHPLPSTPVFDEVLGKWLWEPDGETAGVTEDVFNTGFVNYETGAIELDGPWWYGGFDCDFNPGRPWTDFTPFSGFEITLYGPTRGSFCNADLNEDGYVDFLDISIFVSTLPDYTGDTFFDFLDISAFLNDFTSGCALPGPG